MDSRFVGGIGFGVAALATVVLFQECSKLMTSYGAGAGAEGGGPQMQLDRANVLLFFTIFMAGLVLLQASFVLRALPPAVRVAFIQMASYMGGYFRREINHAF